MYAIFSTGKLIPHTLDRHHPTRIVAYPKPQHMELIVAFAHRNEMSKSEAAAYFMVEYMNRLPQTEREVLRKHYAEMTQQQKNRPRRTNSY